MAKTVNSLGNTLSGQFLGAVAAADNARPTLRAMRGLRRCLFSGGNDVGNNDRGREPLSGGEEIWIAGAFVRPPQLNVGSTRDCLASKRSKVVESSKNKFCKTMSV
jgi:hypothetical protein